LYQSTGKENRKTQITHIGNVGCPICPNYRQLHEIMAMADKNLIVQLVKCNLMSELATCI